MSYRPLWTGIGIIAGWLAAILGLSFYARKWIGAKTWRWLHRWTLAVYVLALAHVVGAGTDGRSPWMLAMLTILTAPIVFAFTYRMLPKPSRSAAPHGRPPRASRPRHERPSQPRMQRRGEARDHIRAPSGRSPVVGRPGVPDTAWARSPGSRVDAITLAGVATSSTATIAISNLAHHLDLPRGHRQHRDHRHRPRPPRPQ